MERRERRETSNTSSEEEESKLCIKCGLDNVAHNHNCPEDLMRVIKAVEEEIEDMQYRASALVKEADNLKKLVALNQSKKLDIERLKDRQREILEKINAHKTAIKKKHYVLCVNCGSQQHPERICDKPRGEDLSAQKRESNRGRGRGSRLHRGGRGRGREELASQIVQLDHHMSDFSEDEKSQSSAQSENK